MSERTVCATCGNPTSTYVALNGWYTGTNGSTYCDPRCCPKLWRTEAQR